MNDDQAPLQESVRGTPSPRVKIPPGVWLAASILALAAGTTIFLYMFILDLELYWLMLAPIILGFYLAPAAYLFRKYRRARRGRRMTGGKASGDESAPDGI